MAEPHSLDSAGHGPRIQALVAGGGSRVWVAST